MKLSGVDTNEYTRAELEGFMDRYLEALIAHDPSRLHVTPDVKFTENGIPLPLGQALWRTASGLGRYKLYAADPKGGQVALIGTAAENGAPVILGVRIKLERHAYREIETVVVRNPGAAQRLDALYPPNPEWARSVHARSRGSRADLIRRANAYLDGIERRSGEDVGFAANCDRLENGLRTTNNPDAGWSTMGAGPPAPGDPSVELFKMNCKDQFNAGMYNFITEARARRFPLVDEERGIVVAAFIFVHPGDILAIDVPGIGRIPYPQSVLRPFDTLLLEMFKIESDEIRLIDAAIYSGAFGLGSGWDP